MQCWLWTNCQATQLQLLRRGETPTAGERTICQGSSCVSLASSNIHTTRRNPGLVCASVILVRLDLFILRSRMDIFLQKMQVPVWINSWTRKINRGKLLPILAANAGQKNDYCIYVLYVCVMYIILRKKKLCKSYMVWAIPYICLSPSPM